jgi:hypothetical protein
LRNDGRRIGAIDIAISLYTFAATLFADKTLGERYQGGIERQAEFRKLLFGDGGAVAAGETGDRDTHGHERKICGPADFETAPGRELKINREEMGGDSPGLVSASFESVMSAAGEAFESSPVVPLRRIDIGGGLAEYLAGFL